MRFLTLGLTIFVLAGISTAAQAESGFGSPFMNEAPTALDGNANPDNALAEGDAARVSEIEPAAGEEEAGDAQNQKQIPTVIIEDESDLHKIQEAIENALTP